MVTPLIANHIVSGAVVGITNLHATRNRNTALINGIGAFFVGLGTEILLPGLSSALTVLYVANAVYQNVRTRNRAVALQNTQINANPLEDQELPAPPVFDPPPALFRGTAPAA